MDVTRPSEVSELLRQYGISVRKSWGQNFLINKSVVERILDVTDLEGAETVLEIGPGLGVMTARLMEMVPRVVAIEIDPLLCRVLSDRFNHVKTFILVQGDALEQDLSVLVPGRYVVVANLPYYITSPLLVKLVEQKNPPLSAVFLVQWEVGKRITALPGTSDYGALSVLIQYHCQADLLHKIGPGNFYPPPKVDSAVVRLRWRPPIRRPKDEELMFRLVKAAFGQRRKMLKGLLAREIGLQPAVAASILERIGVPGDIRGEKLSVQDFAALADLVGDYLV